MYKKILFITFLLCLNSCSSTPNTCNFEKKPEQCTLVIGFVPSQQAQTLKDDIKPLEEYLQKELQEQYPGLKVESFVAVKYMGLIAGMKAGTVDISFLAPFSYLLSRRDTEKINTPTKPLLRTIRFGKNSYRAQILASRSSNIESIKDLKGKLFAFTDPASTSGFLYPQITLLSEGIDYRTDLKNYAMLGSHDNVVQGIYRGEWDAGATYEDARKNFVYDFENIAPGFKVELTFTDMKQICVDTFLHDTLEKNFWDILMRYQSPIVDSIAQEIMPYLKNMEVESKTTIKTTCGLTEVKILEKWDGEIFQLALTTPIPNDIVAARGDLDENLMKEIEKIFIELPEKNNKIFEILNNIYSIEGFEKTNHEDFLELKILAEKSGLL